MSAVPFENVVARQFRLAKAPTLFARCNASAPIAFSRLSVDGAFRGTTMPVPPQPAFTVQVALGPMPVGEIWVDGRYSQLSAAAPGDTFVFDLASNPIANLRPPFDFLRFYLPVSTMDELAYDRGLRRIGALRAGTVGQQDQTMHGLALSIVPALRNPEAKNAAFLDYVALAFHAHVVGTYGSPAKSGRAHRAELAPWQLRRVDDYINAYLGDDPSIADLAGECRLSADHFARAFTQSMGMPPHRWLLRRRVDRAKQLMLTDDQSLAQIALACGFVDQSHLGRVFLQMVKCTPARWRRLRQH